MNVFLACFLAVIFASIVRDIAQRTIVQWLVDRAMKRRIKRGGMAQPSTLPDATRRLLDASSKLQAAAIDVAEKGPSETSALLTAAGVFYVATTQEIRTLIRDHARTHRDPT